MHLSMNFFMNPNLHEFMKNLESINMFYEIMHVFMETMFMTQLRLSIKVSTSMFYETLPHDMNEI